ncbi:MAG: hypothetical protein LBP73_03595 [Clostridiales Family XIII bacterium]|jgi:hypothetical protein|nr:hypothetical protein [Clostridiales Family XIII bacterium]
MRCESCNTQNAPGAEYCAGCGERLFYDEEFFKRENNVDALPKLSDEMKPIRAFKGGRWPAVIARSLFNASGKAAPETEQAKKRGNAEAAVAFCIVAVLLAVLFVTRVLR